MNFDGDRQSSNLLLFGNSECSYQRDPLKHTFIVRSSRKISRQVVPGVVTADMDTFAPKAALRHIVHFSTIGYISRATFLTITGAKLILLNDPVVTLGFAQLVISRQLF